MRVSMRQILFRPAVNFYRTINTAGPRVRFAPSPTGYLHLGGLRTALYNYLFAKSRGGTFILRIEDTDQTRKVEGAVEALKRDLEWAGIEVGEGPGIAGDYEPYVQSERLDIYQEHITNLLYNGSAYKCFCSERRLNMLRRDAVRARCVPRYDNRCRALSHQEVMDKMKAGIPYCIRFKLTPDVLSFEDLIFGGIAYDVSANEGDPVLMKSDGFPTYHFANVVDDHLMKITHVLRGVEWQISTTKHLLIYRAFGWTAPEFGHLPLIVNSDGTKLSKRQNDVRVEDYRNKGVLPLALVNYITMAGGGFLHAAGEGVRIKSLQELARELDISRISSHPSRLNPALLAECSRQELRRRLAQPALAPGLVAALQRLIRRTYPHRATNTSAQHIHNVLRWATSRISTIEDLVSDEFGFLWVLPSQQTEIDQKTLQKLLQNLEKLDRFEEAEIKEYLRSFSSENGVRFPELMSQLRAVLSGQRRGPAVADMMALLGREQCLERIKAGLRLYYSVLF